MLDPSILRLAVAEKLFLVSGPDIGAQMGELLGQYPGYSAEEMDQFRKSMTTRWRVIITTLLSNHVLSRVSGEEEQANLAELLGPKFSTEEMTFISSIIVSGVLKICLDLGLVNINIEKTPAPLVRPTSNA